MQTMMLHDQDHIIRQNSGIREGEEGGMEGITVYLSLFARSHSFGFPRAHLSMNSKTIHESTRCSSEKTGTRQQGR